MLYLSRVIGTLRGKEELLSVPRVSQEIKYFKTVLVDTSELECIETLRIRFNLGE